MRKLAFSKTQKIVQNERLFGVYGIQYVRLQVDEYVSVGARGNVCNRFNNITNSVRTQLSLPIHHHYPMFTAMRADFNAPVNRPLKSTDNKSIPSLQR